MRFCVYTSLSRLLSDGFGDGPRERKTWVTTIIWVFRTVPTKRLGLPTIFRACRSTNDTLHLLRKWLVNACNARCYSMAVSLDVRNAFKTIGWKTGDRYHDAGPYGLSAIPPVDLGLVLKSRKYEGNVSVIVRVICPPGLSSRASPMERRVQHNALPSVAEGNDYYQLCGRYVDHDGVGHGGGGAEPR